eukprot:jgi/Bigna1/83933/fgenesh1_pg.118_\
MHMKMIQEVEVEERLECDRTRQLLLRKNTSGTDITGSNPVTEKCLLSDDELCEKRENFVTRGSFGKSVKCKSISGQSHCKSSQGTLRCQNSQAPDTNTDTAEDIKMVGTCHQAARYCTCALTTPKTKRANSNVIRDRKLMLQSLLALTLNTFIVQDAAPKKSTDEAKAEHIDDETGLSEHENLPRKSEATSKHKVDQHFEGKNKAVEETMRKETHFAIGFENLEHRLPDGCAIMEGVSGQRGSSRQGAFVLSWDHLELGKRMNVAHCCTIRNVLGMTNNDSHTACETPNDKCRMLSVPRIMDVSSLVSLQNSVSHRTLFNLITGKAKRTGGRALLNGEEEEPSDCKRLE